MAAEWGDFQLRMVFQWIDDEKTRDTVWKVCKKWRKNSSYVNPTDSYIEALLADNMKLANELWDFCLDSGTIEFSEDLYCRVARYGPLSHFKAIFGVDIPKEEFYEHLDWGLHESLCKSNVAVARYLLSLPETKPHFDTEQKRERWIRAVVCHNNVDCLFLLLDSDLIEDADDRVLDICEYAYCLTNATIKALMGHRCMESSRQRLFEVLVDRNDAGRRFSLYEWLCDTYDDELEVTPAMVYLLFNCIRTGAVGLSLRFYQRMVSVLQKEPATLPAMRAVALYHMCAQGKIDFVRCLLDSGLFEAERQELLGRKDRQALSRTIIRLLKEGERKEEGGKERKGRRSKKADEK